MRAPHSLALAALLGTFVSGNFLLPRAASCDWKGISFDVKISNENFFGELPPAMHRACTRWINTDNINGVFSVAPFKLSHSGAIGAANIDDCVSSLEFIVEHCRSEDSYYGGSTESHGVSYAIEGVDSGLVTKLETRGKKGNSKGKGKGTSALKTSAAKTKATKTMSSKSSAKSSAKTAGAKSSATSPPKSTAKSSVKSSGKSSATRSVKSTAKSSVKSSIKPSATTSSTGPNCKPRNAAFTSAAKSKSGSKATGTTSGKKSKQTGSVSKAGKRDSDSKLTGRSVMLQLIRNFSRSLEKRGEKKVTLCNGFLKANDYPRAGELKSSRPGVTLFGFDKQNILQWNEGKANEVGQVGRGDTEHVLEWQTVASFFEDHLQNKIGETTPVCDVLQKYVDGKGKGNKSPKPPTFDIEVDDEDGNRKVLSGTFSELLAEAYPSKGRYEEEFVILDWKPNGVIKMHMFSDLDVVKEDTLTQRMRPMRPWAT
ncbi:unnamed protein product [Periconia digitata]|uniref:Uncharacterized protein n=1 Tax=Periconia digitata TaxID=1303443 RepID=A0A9W4UF82_9PLEO|nr:unnamed protein product [Periconia digitata]